MREKYDAKALGDRESLRRSGFEVEAGIGWLERDGASDLSEDEIAGPDDVSFIFFL